jgi:hypothetical protein
MRKNSKRKYAFSFVRYENNNKILVVLSLCATTILNARETRIFIFFMQARKIVLTQQKQAGNNSKHFKKRKQLFYHIKFTIECTISRMIFPLNVLLTSET